MNFEEQVANPPPPTLPLSISIIGAGRMAHNLVCNFLKAGLGPITLINRTIDSAQSLAIKFDINDYSTKYSDIPNTVDWVIIAVSDDSISSVAKRIKPFVPQTATVSHCSGVKPISILDVYESYGLFYPLASMSKEHYTDFGDIPIIIDGNQPKALDLHRSLAYRMSHNVHHLRDNQRPYLHLAAVFANNFTTDLMITALKILKDKGISRDMLYPIMEQTMKKVLDNTTEDIQTGPAIRLDENTMDTHQQLLQSERPLLASLYKLLSADIIERQLTQQHYTESEKQKALNILTKLNK